MTSFLPGLPSVSLHILILLLCRQKPCAVIDCVLLRVSFVNDMASVAGSLHKPLSTANTDALCPDSGPSVDLPIWMNGSHHDMLFGMLCLPKKTVLSYLKRIPSYARR